MNMNMNKKTEIVKYFAEWTDDVGYEWAHIEVSKKEKTPYLAMCSSADYKSRKGWKFDDEILRLWVRFRTPTCGESLFVDPSNGKAYHWEHDGTNSMRLNYLGKISCAHFAALFKTYEKNYLDKWRKGRTNWRNEFAKLGRKLAV